MPGGRGRSPARERVPSCTVCDVVVHVVVDDDVVDDHRETGGHLVRVRNGLGAVVSHECRQVDFGQDGLQRPDGFEGGVTLDDAPLGHPGVERDADVLPGHLVLLVDAANDVAEVRGGHDVGGDAGEDRVPHGIDVLLGELADGVDEVVLVVVVREKVPPRQRGVFCGACAAVEEQLRRDSALKDELVGDVLRSGQGHSWLLLS